MIQLPHNMFGLEAFSLRNAYLRCIGEQLRDALNDTGYLGTIYQGLTNYIFAKNGRAQNIPRITKQACVRSPISCTLYLLKHVAGTHIRNHHDNFLLSPTNLETNWLAQARSHPNLSIKLCYHFLNKLLLHHITDLTQITLSNGTHLMTPTDFQIYHAKPTKIICSALKLASQLFCHQPCNNHCHQPYTHHQSPNTLLPQYIVHDHHIIPPRTTTQNPPPTNNQPPCPPPQIWTLLKYIPINSITKYKQCTTRDKLTITKKHHLYLCTWIHNNHTTYAKWISQTKLYQIQHQNHNLQILKQYYQTRQFQHFTQIIQKSFNTTQNKDTRYITPPTYLPLVKISIIECNPENDIMTTGHTI
jgi:hypothetical protein